MTADSGRLRSSGGQAELVSKCRRKSIYGRLRRDIGGNIRELCRQAGAKLVEAHAMADHVHLCLSIPPKYSVANTAAFLNGKSAIRIHRKFLGQKRNFAGLHFWATGYCVGTVQLDEQVIRAYIQNQEETEKRSEQMRLEGLYALSMRQPPPSGAFTIPPALRVFS